MRFLELLQEYFSPTPEKGLVFNEEHDNDPRNLRYEDIAPLGATLELPQSFELPQKAWTLNQGKTASCTAHAVIHGLSVETGKEASPRHLFWKIKTDPKYASSRLGWGAFIKDAVDCLINEGASSYEFAPNDAIASDAEYLALKETFSMISSQGANKGGRYVYVTSGTDNIQKMYDIMRFIWEQQRPVVFGIDWRSSMNVARKGGVVPAAVPTGNSAGHAILAIGWKRINNHIYLICQNSWGSGWGDRGRVYIPQGFARISSGLGVIRSEEIPKPAPKPTVRNLHQEKADAEALRDAIYAKYPIDIPGVNKQRNIEARGLAGKMWLVLAPAVTYRGWTKTDVINFLWARSRKLVDNKAYNLDFYQEKSK